MYDHIKFFIISCFIVLFSVSQLLGTTYYISTTGNDNNIGSINEPWSSLNHAIKIAGAGDTVLIREGNYVTNEVLIRGNRGMGGANGSYLTIKSYPGETVSVGGSRRFIIKASFVRVEGLYFRLPYRISASGEGIQIIKNLFVGPQPDYGAIEFISNNGLIKGNRIEITGGGNTLDHGIYLHYGKNNIIRGNYISGASGYGIHIYDERKSRDPVDFIRRYENIVIERNLIINSSQKAGIIISAGESAKKAVDIDGVIVRNNIVINNGDGIAIRYYGKIRNVDILNNVIYGNASDGISISAFDVDNITIKNNILCFNGNRHIKVRSKSLDLIISHNLYHQPTNVGEGATDNNPIFGAPLFIDVTRRDFSLQTGSPAIDAGIDVGLPFSGAAPDIGVFEYKY